VWVPAVRQLEPGTATGFITEGSRRRLMYG
jgi:hypothetical protein